MTGALVRQLALKDLYFARWPLVGGVAGGLLSLAVAPLSAPAFYAGSVGFICALIVLNIFVVMSGVVGEKKDKVLLFLLSLPVSSSRYWIVKMITNLLIFFAPWLLLTTAAGILIVVSGIPDGLLPFHLAICGFILCYYCVLLGVAISSGSLAWTTTVIVTGNISVNFFIPLVFRLPSAVGVSGKSAAWGPDIAAVLLGEVLFCIAVLTLTAIVQMRRRDFV